MELINEQEYSSTLLFDLNTYFYNIRVPKYRVISDLFYKNEGYDIDSLRKLLMKTPLEFLTNYLIFAGFEFKKMQEGLLESTRVALGKKVVEAKTLKLMRKVSHANIDIRISTLSEQHRIESLDIKEGIQQCLEKTFESEDPNNPSTHIKISNDDLNTFIVKEEQVAFRKGAPFVVHRVAKFAELLLFFIHYNMDEICPSNPYNFTGYNSAECKLVHDYLLFWNLIENKQWKNEKKDYDIRQKYIRTMIKNLRNQRKKWENEKDDK